MKPTTNKSNAKIFVKSGNVRNCSLIRDTSVPKAKYKTAKAPTIMTKLSKLKTTAKGTFVASTVFTNR